MENAKLTQHRTGFWEVTNKPSAAELEAYYANIYFQTSQGAYEQTYSEAELTYFQNGNAIKHLLTERYLATTTTERRLLDIGCGEGFTLDYFSKQHWEVLGLDYSVDGVQRQNPAMTPYVRQGDLYQSMQQLLTAGEQFQLITVLNVLEHVIDPAKLLQDLHQLLAEGGVLLIVVPNDFSVLQEQLYASNQISRRFWIRYPDHLNYFRRESLVKLCEEQHFRPVGCLSDFPIDYFLANPDSNYIEDSSKGKNCHKARIWLDNLQCSISLEQTIRLYEAFAELGTGRQISAYFVKA